MADRHLTDKERHEENERFWQERRKYFRIDDNVMLKYRVIPTEEVQSTTDRLKVPIPNAFSLSSDFAAMREQITMLKRSIEKNNMQIAQYMQLIDRKLDMVAKVLLVQNMGGDENLWRLVNLGAGGIAFDSPVVLPASSILEIKLGLLPSHAGLRTLGKVLRSDKLPEGKIGYRVAVAFLHVRDSDRELLVQHILWRQAQALRDQRSVTDQHDN